MMSVKIEEESQEYLREQLQNATAAACEKVEPSKRSKNKKKDESSRKSNPEVKKGYDCQVVWTRKIRETIEELEHKYFFEMGEDRRNQVVRRILDLKQAGLKTFAAIYFEFFDQIHLLSSKGFCKRNGLKVKEFNRAYLAYNRQFKGSKLSRETFNDKEEVQNENEACHDPENDPPSPFHQVKEEEVESSFYDQKFVLEGMFLRKTGLAGQKVVLSAVEAVDLVFDNLFNSFLIQEKRREVIEKIAERCLETQQRIIDGMTWTDNNLLKFYYILYIHLKKCQKKLKFYDYRKYVEKETGFDLDSKELWRTRRLFNVTDNKDIERQGQRSNNVLIEESQVWQYFTNRPTDL